MGRSKHNASKDLQNTPILLESCYCMRKIGVLCWTIHWGVCYSVPLDTLGTYKDRAPKDLTSWILLEETLPSLHSEKWKWIPKLPLLCPTGERNLQFFRTSQYYMWVHFPVLPASWQAFSFLRIHSVFCQRAMFSGSSPVPWRNNLCISTTLKYFFLWPNSLSYCLSLSSVSGWDIFFPTSFFMIPRLCS